MLRKIILATASMVLGLISINAFAGHATLEDCIKVVNGVKKGSISRVEYHNFSNEGKPAYELEIVDSDGVSWEFECNKHGNIVEIERKSIVLLILYSRPEQKSQKRRPRLQHSRYTQARTKKQNMRLNLTVRLPMNLISRVRTVRNSMLK